MNFIDKQYKNLRRSYRLHHKVIKKFIDEALIPPFELDLKNHSVKWI